MVFDGYEDCRYPGYDEDIEVLFSRKESADERIKKIVSESGNAKNIVVVSEDKEIKFFTRACGARVFSAEEFFKYEKKNKVEKQDSFKPELTFTQMHEINKELRRIWLE